MTPRELDGARSVLYLTAAMTGLRQGELLALRWRDFDWAARVVLLRRPDYWDCTRLGRHAISLDDGSVARRDESGPRYVPLSDA